MAVVMQPTGPERESHARDENQIYQTDTWKKRWELKSQAKGRGFVVEKGTVKSREVCHLGDKEGVS